MIISLLLLTACTGETPVPSPTRVDADADSDTDADSDSDTDADSDSDTDADSDSDTDADSDADADSDTDADSDSDTDADSDADTDTDTDCVDSDSDGVCDTEDLCPGGDDTLDADSDGTPDACDPCPNDALDDADGDGVCDGEDACLGHPDTEDEDGDGVPDGCDLCPMDPLDDSDGDGACDSDDLCPGHPDGEDGDGDGVADGCDPCPTDLLDDSDGDGSCDSVDLCPGEDDTLDEDGDGAPDACDLCPTDPLDDSDGDGVCDGVDSCPGHPDSQDMDGDGVADGCDDCPLDALDDSDGDGFCDSDDLCPGADDTIDSDADGEIDGCELRINELVSENDTTVVLGDGSTPDWVELYNPAPFDVSLTGFALIDSETDTPYDLPALTVPAGGTLLLLASGDEDLGDDHLPFRLDNDGDDLFLYRGDQVIDSIDFGEMIDDVSLARVGFDDWIVTDAPSPDAANPAGTGGSDPVDLPCEPDWTGVRYVTEGERLQVTADCTLPGAFDLQVFGTVPGLSGTSIDWQTDLDDAATHDLLLVAKPAGHRGVPETERREVSVADAWNAPGNIGVDPLEYQKEWGLPVLHIETTTTLTQSYSDITGILDGDVYAGQAKIRGASSSSYPKNSYTLEFDPDQIQLKPYGLQKKDQFVLVSTFDDNSYIRQRFIYETWQDVADFWMVDRLTPRTMDLVVYIDGQYHGFYTGIDHIDDEFIREMDFDDSGDLYKSVNHHANFRLTDTSGNPKSDLAQGWEKKKGLPENDFTTMQELTAFTGGSTPAEFAADHADWVDLHDTMDWYWLVRHTASNDSAAKNAYLYQDPESGRFRYVPWDFNHALGQNWKTLRVDVNGLSSFYSTNIMFAHAQDEPSLNAEREARYAAMREDGGPYHLDEMLGRADKLLESLGPHGERDFEKWGAQYVSFPRWSSRTDFTTHEEEVQYVLDWIVARDAVMEAAHP